MVRILIALAATVLTGNAYADERAEVQTVGDYTRVYGLEPIRVEGIGLVVGLKGTGGDPPPGVHRERIIELMRHNNVEQPEKLLASREVAGVLLRGFVPPGIRQGEPIDVEVYCLPGDNTTTSLKGGFLLKVVMTEVLLTKRGAMNGQEWVNVEGPVMVTETTNAKNEESYAKSGRILGRGKVKRDRNFTVTINREFRSARLSKELASHINARFHKTSEFDTQEGMAKAVDNMQIQLSLPDVYKNNILRYLHVVRRIPFKLSERGRAALVRSLKEKLRDPSETYNAAMQFESLGTMSVGHLKEALDDKSQIVRFSVAEALAYLGDIRGVKELGYLAETESLYRAYALAALTAPTMPAARFRLIRLLHTPGAETRYGAFLSLRSVDPNEPTIRGQFLADDFYLHEVASTAEPMVHVARRFRPEIVVFGKEQKLKAPVLLTVADHLIVTHMGHGEKIMLTSIRKGRDPYREECEPYVGEVIRRAAKMGVKYPEVVELLRQASANGCLEGRLEINALPRAVSIATLAKGQESEGAMQLPSGVPSIFAEDGSEAEAAAVLAEADDDKDTKIEEKAPKKPWWKRPFSFFGN